MGLLWCPLGGAVVFFLKPLWQKNDTLCLLGCDFINNTLTYLYYDILDMLRLLLKYLVQWEKRFVLFIP